jgi:ribosome-associated toxin RatA of RatAB toxin-antitoxin module
MGEVTRSVLIARPVALVYGLINDFERYPEFVPGCVSAQLLARSATEVVARLGARQGPLSLEFTTRNRLTPCTAIDMQLVDGPFTELTGGWQLTALSGSGCRATLSLRFEFDNPVTTAVLAPFFEMMIAGLVDAFVLRARQMPSPG